MLHYITPEIITIMGHIYSNKFLADINIDKSDIQLVIDEKIKKSIEMKNVNLIGVNLQNAIVFYSETVRTIVDELSRYSTYDTLNFIKLLDPKMKPYIDSIEKYQIKPKELY